MFVLKSTLARVEAERDIQLSIIEASRDAHVQRCTRLMIERDESRRRHAITETEACQLATEVGLLSAKVDELRKSVDDHCRAENEMRAELAKTYVHDAKGRIARHPSAAK